MSGERGHAWQRGCVHGMGVCVARGMCGRGACLAGGGSAWQGSMRDRECVHAGETATEVGSLHQTGMYSCF